MTDRGWAVHDLTETEGLVAQAYVDGLRSGRNLESVKKDAEIEKLEDRADELQARLEAELGVSIDD